MSSAALQFSDLEADHCFLALRHGYRGADAHNDENDNHFTEDEGASRHRYLGRNATGWKIYNPYFSILRSSVDRPMPRISAAFCFCPPC